MYDRSYALATGLFLVAALAGLAATAYWLTGIDPERRPYVVVSAYSVAGLGEGSELLYRGVPAGRVDRIAIDPEEPSRVLVRISVDPAVPVHHSTYARLRQRGFTGLAQVELHDTGEHRQLLPTDRRQPARIPMRPSLVDEVADTGAQALATFNAVAEALQSALGNDNLEQMRNMMGRIDSTLAAIEQTAHTLQSELPHALQGAARSADAVTAFAQRATASMDEVEQLLVELRATTVAARQLGEQLSDQAPGFERTLEAFDRAAQEVSRLAQSLARQPERLLRPAPAPLGPGEE